MKNYYSRILRKFARQGIMSKSSTTHQSTNSKNAPHPATNNSNTTRNQSPHRRGLSPDPELTEEQRQVFREAFQMFDKDNDGVITSTELGDLMRSLGQQVTETEVNDLLNEVDIDGNGTIELNEFIEMMRRPVPDDGSDEELRAAFNAFDADGNGFISHSELKNVMLSLGEGLTDGEIMEMIIEADLNGDGLIDFEEFKNMMTNIH